MTRPQPTLAHLDALTGVRALAALWVFLHHAWLAGGAKPVALSVAGLRADFTPWFAFGWLGLDIFFILSGFLLTRQEWLRQEREVANGAGAGKRRFRDFYATFLRNRIMRVYPAYYLCLTLLIVLAATHVYLKLPGRVELLLHLPMMHNAIEAYIATMNGVFWTLPFEWTFYLVFPFLFVFLVRSGPWLLAAWVVAIVLAAKAVVLASDDGFMQTQLPIRLDSFVFGMCAGRFAASAPLLRRAATLAFWVGLVALMCTPILFSDLPTGNHYYNLKGFVRPLWIELSVILMLLGITGERHPGVAMFGNKVAVGLGLISYSIYLLHVPVMELFIIHRPKLGPLATLPYGLPLVLAVAFPLVILASYISYKLVEQPFQRHRVWRGYWWSKTGSGLLGRVDPLVVLLAWAVLLIVARELLA